MCITPAILPLPNVARTSAALRQTTKSSGAARSIQCRWPAMARAIGCAISGVIRSGSGTSNGACFISAM
jgi:hypothetical protein